MKKRGEEDVVITKLIMNILTVHEKRTRNVQSCLNDRVNDVTRHPVSQKRLAMLSVRFHITYAVLQDDSKRKRGIKRKREKLYSNPSH